MMKIIGFALLAGVAATVIAGFVVELCGADGGILEQATPAVGAPVAGAVFDGGRRRAPNG